MGSLCLGETFPNFQAPAFGLENFDLYEYLGGSILPRLFGCTCATLSHPNDFTPVCTTELARAATLVRQFEAKNCKIVGFSCNDVESHEQWARDVMAYAGLEKENLPFPLVADPKRTLAEKLGIMDPDERDSAGIPLTCRCVVFIGPDKKVKASILYPATTGRCFKEILRVLDSLQLTSKFPVATPAEWSPNSKCCVVPNLSSEQAAKELEKGVEVHNLPSERKRLKDSLNLQLERR